MQRDAAWVSISEGKTGTTIALAGSRLLKELLFEVSPRDPAVFVGVGALLFLVAIVASLAPAIKASRADPMTALRTE